MVDWGLTDIGQDGGLTSPRPLLCARLLIAPSLWLTNVKSAPAQAMILMGSVADVTPPLPAIVGNIPTLAPHYPYGFAV